MLIRGVLGTNSLLCLAQGMEKAVAEIIQLQDGDAIDPDSDHVIIQKVNGKFVANGSVAGNGYAAFFTPDPFDTEDEAFAAASQWADANGSPAIYVRDADRT